MKSAMPFLGVGVADARLIARTAAAAGERDADALRETVRGMWDAASHREERYAPMAVFALPSVRGNVASTPLIERTLTHVP